MGDLDKAKELFEQIPALLDKKKIGGKDLPTEVFIKKKRASAVFVPYCPHDSNENLQWRFTRRRQSG